MSKSIKWKTLVPIALGCLSIAGMCVTAALLIKEAPVAADRIKKAETEKGETLTVVEKAKIATPVYAPAIGIGVTTIGCVVGMTVLDRRSQASLASAYGLVSTGFSRYKGKVKELFGEEAHQKVVDSITKETVKDTEVLAYGLGGATSLEFGVDEEIRLFYDTFSDRYFETTIGKVLQAEMHLNRNFCIGGEVALNEFYEFLGLEHIDGGDDIGWTIQDELYFIDFDHHSMTLEDGLQCCVIDMVWLPTRASEWD